MALNIRNREVDELAEAVTRLSGESKTQAVICALRERLARLERDRGRPGLADELDEIAVRCARLPVQDSRPADQILGDGDTGQLR